MATRILVGAHDLVVQASLALQLTQREMAALLGISLRTSQRMQGGAARPTDAHMRTLAAHVYPVNPALASEIAVASGSTLEQLGIVRPPPPPAPAPPPVAARPPGPPRPPAEELIDSVVCAAAEAQDVMPREIRGALLAAFARGRRLGLTMEEGERALRATMPRAAAANEGALVVEEAEAAAVEKKTASKKR